MPRRIAALCLVFALAAGGLVSAGHAAAPQQKTQAPGYYRMMLGDFEVTALSDGTVDLPVDKLLSGAKPGQVQRALQRAYLGVPVETSVNAYLINTGSRLILIDTGAAGLFGPTLGKLLGHLKAAGYQPEQIDEVCITHLHPDHVGGLLAQGEAAFPNATVRFDQREADYWLSNEQMAKAPDETKGFFVRAMEAVKPYRDAGRLQPFSGSTELAPGVRALAAPGHTPGHTFYIIESKAQKLVVWGDLMHVAAVQFPDPSVVIKFDVDSKLALPQRRKAFAEAAREGYYVALAHVAFPGIGRLRADGKGYVWVPVNYSTKP
ncbi:MBL fold metallo-hydrolase [Methylibium sp.]|uniref:MBL fold metallo-hydrolase n=1 Tax=Methylibium sp. TaxID=2067992 RepID=UPI003D0D09EF